MRGPRHKIQYDMTHYNTSCEVITLAEIIVEEMTCSTCRHLQEVFGPHVNKAPSAQHPIGVSHGLVTVSCVTGSFKLGRGDSWRLATRPFCPLSGETYIRAVFYFAIVFNGMGASQSSGCVVIIFGRVSFFLTPYQS